MIREAWAAAPAPDGIDAVTENRNTDSVLDALADVVDSAGYDDWGERHASGYADCRLPGTCRSHIFVGRQRVGIEMGRLDRAVRRDGS